MRAMMLEMHEWHDKPKIRSIVMMMDVISHKTNFDEGNLRST